MSKDIEELREKLLREVVKQWQHYGAMVPLNKYPTPGQYYVTGCQAGNEQGQIGWWPYIGYVVQVRLKAGAFGTDLILLRHPNGELRAHSNQSFYRLAGFAEAIVKTLYPDGVTFEEYEDPAEEYTVSGSFPESGAVVEPGCQQGTSVTGSVTVTARGDKTVLEVQV